MIAFIQQLSIWNWLLFGILFLAVELIWNKGYCFWYAVIVGFIGLLQVLLPHYEGYAQLITFIALSAIVTGLWRVALRSQTSLRRPGMENFNIAAAYIGKTFTLQKNMKKLHANVLLDNRIWKVRAKENLKKGADVKIIGHDGVILIIQAMEMAIVSIPCKQSRTIA